MKIVLSLHRIASVHFRETFLLGVALLCRRSELAKLRTAQRGLQFTPYPIRQGPVTKDHFYELGAVSSVEQMLSCSRIVWISDFPS